MDVSELARIFRVIGQVLRERIVTVESAEDLAGQVGRNVESFQRGELGKSIRASIGVDLGVDTGLATLLDGFVAENVALIQSVPERMLQDMNSTIARMIQEGSRAEEIAAALTERFGVAERRAALIARDQANKFFGKVNERRQESLGITEFIWRTQNDERVRPQHRAYNGKKYKWSNPPGGEIPGEPINCRCYAEPVFDSIFEGDEDQ
jgi:SPP1 gp7 family putative phage head morphogenesis protein